MGFLQHVERGIDGSPLGGTKTALAPRVQIGAGQRFWIAACLILDRWHVTERRRSQALSGRDAAEQLEALVVLGLDSAGTFGELTKTLERVRVHRRQDAEQPTALDHALACGN